jgi:chemotaxis protein MotA
MKAYTTKILLVVSAAALGWTIFRFDPSGQVFNVPGLLVVVAGTFLATAFGQSFKAVIELLRQLPQKLARQALHNESDLNCFIRAAELYRKANVPSAEAAVRRIENPFLRSGAQLVLDRTPYTDVSRVLQWRIGALRERDTSDIQVFQTMMTFAPAFGMIGTLFGLIAMLYGLELNNLRHLGGDMGFAMLTTVYGLLLANLVLKPIVTRLEQRSRERLAWWNVQFEAVLMMYDKCHPKLIRDYLEAYEEHPEGVESDSPAPLNEIKSVVGVR